MALTRIQWSWQGKSGLATDRYINTFYCAGLAPDASNAATLQSVVSRFYGTSVAGLEGTGAVSGFIPGDALNQSSNVVVKMYHMEDAEPRVPFYEDDENILCGTAQGLPTEVAVCLSYRANPVSGVPQARRKGRIFIGPLTVLALETANANGYVRPDLTLRGILIAAADRMASEFAAAGQIWSVHSPTTGSTSSAQITQVRCDDAFDTQRRRGLDPTLTAWTPL